MAVGCLIGDFPDRHSETEAPVTPSPRAMVFPSIPSDFIASFSRSGGFTVASINFFNQPLD